VLVESDFVLEGYLRDEDAADTQERQRADSDASS
jgi:hypothetical protein